MSSLPLINDNDEELSSLLDPETLERLRAEHPTAFYTILEADEGPVAVVFRRLTTAQFKRAIQMVNDPRRTDRAAETTANDVIIHPLGEQLAALREQLPGLNDRVGSFALLIAKGEVPKEAKKLQTSPAKRPAGTSPSTPAR